jgi:amino acid transporter
MAVAAANKNWLPRAFSLTGQLGLVTPSQSTSTASDDDNSPATKSPKSDAPINSLLLAAFLSIVYILIGDFRSLLTFNGLGEYTFFFFTVVGAIILSFREPDLQRPYKPPILVPAVFALVSGFVVVRGAVFAPIPAAVLLGLWVTGYAFYWLRMRYHGGEP